MAHDKDSEENEMEESINFKGPCIGQRHYLAFICSVLVATLYYLRVNLSVAIVAMVNNTVIVHSGKENSSNDECPVPKTNETTIISSNGSFLWSRDLQGLVLGSFFWGYLVFQLPSGTLSQRFGGKWILASAVISNIILTVLTPVAASFSPYLLIVVRIIEGFFQGVLFPAMQAMLGRWVPPKEAGFLYMLAYSGMAIGTIMGQVVSGQLCQSLWGWPSAFYASALIAAVGLVPWLLFAYNSPEENPRISADELAYISRHLGSGSQEKSNRIGVPWLSILTDAAIWANIVGIIGLSWIFNVNLYCLPQYLSDVLHFDISTNGALSSLPQIVYFPVGIIAGILSDFMVTKLRVRPIVARKVLYTGSILGCIGCMCGVVFTNCNVPATVTLLMILMGFISVASVPLNANIAELSPDFSGTIMAIVNSLGTIPSFMAPIVTDNLTAHGMRDEWSKVFYIGSGIALFGGLFFAIFASSEPRKWNREGEQELLINADKETQFQT